MPWINGQSGSTRIANGGGIVTVNADGSVSVTPASGTGLLLGVAPPATTHYALMQIGNGPIDGLAAGHYTGNASGGGFGANFVSGYTGDLLRLQVAGADKLFVDNAGNVTAASTVTAVQFTGGGSSMLMAGSGPQMTAGGNAGWRFFSGSSTVLATLSVNTRALQTTDAFSVTDSASHQQFAVANVGTGAAPVWALRVRAVANAESMAQAHTLGAYTGKSVQVIDDAGVTIGWQPLYA